MKYSPSKIEGKWQRYWEKQKFHETQDFVPGKNNFMLLVEFPYPSGDLHVGHWYAFSIPDIYGRYLKMRGYNVMFPIGFDAFGLPAENAAIKRGIHPEDWTQKNILTMTKQLRSIGAQFDWSREVQTINPDYYRWTQWIFLKLQEKGLAYRKKTLVNWCPFDKTVLANEQVIDGKCDRCHNQVVQKELAQWMFKITAFADSLIDDLEGLDWEETAKLNQRNWIGRSEGTIAEFKIKDSEDSIEVFTTRADTMFGATYVVLAPEHPLVGKLISKVSNVDEIRSYQSETKRKTELQRMTDVKEKTGVEMKGIVAINPVNKQEIPVWVADYVLAHYGTGAVMAVPAHDERDFEFAQKFNLPIKEVILNDQESDGAKEEDGILENSGEFDGMSSEEARQKITQKLKAQGLGGFEKKYRLHDWILSRQRYWGVPIPMIVCKDCGYQPVPEKDLPVKLPPLKDFMPADDGRSPLAKAVKWLKVKCPNCGKDAERETDTMDTFVDSSWYYLRYTDPDNNEKFADQDKMSKWLPVPFYYGGAEHTTMHLLYSRFITKALNSLGYLEFSEPFLTRRNRGFILGPDGHKMSKSRGNVIDPDELVEKFGADTVRMYLAFMGPYEQGGPWNTNSISGVYRFLNRVWDFVSRHSDKKLSVAPGKEIDVAINRAVKDMTNDISHHKFNTGVSTLMKLFNALEKIAGPNQKLLTTHYSLITKLLAPFAPHLAEELWMEVLSNKESVHLQSWPEWDEKLLAEELVTIIIQVNGRLRDSIQVKPGLSETAVKDLALQNEKVKKDMTGKEVKKVIYIQDKLINLVI